MKQSLWAIAAAACFSIMGAFVKFCTEDLGSFELVFYRSLFGAIFIAFVVLSKRNTSGTISSDLCWVSRALRCGFMPCRRCISAPV